MNSEEMKELLKWLRDQRDRLEREAIDASHGSESAELWGKVEMIDEIDAHVAGRRDGRRIREVA